MPIACDILKYLNTFDVDIYDIRTKEKSHYQGPKYELIQEVVDDLIVKYGNDIGNIIVNKDDLKSDELEGLKKYDNLVHVVTKEELDFEYYLESKVEYTIGDLVILFKNNSSILYEYTEVAERKVTWKQLDEKEHKFHERIDFEYVERMFRLTMNQVHAVFGYSKDEINSLYGSELEKYDFKSVNFINSACRTSLILSRLLLGDPKISALVKVDSFIKSDPQTYTVEDQGFICIPKLVMEYQPRTDIMGIDLGATKCVLTVSRNRDIQVVPFDNYFPGDLWTESVVSFDQEKPIIGKAAIRKFKTKPDHVIFDAKFLCNNYHRKGIPKQSMWPFKVNLDKSNQLFVEANTFKGLKKFALAEINKIFLEQMKEAASEYQCEFNNKKSVEKAVITVPQYYRSPDIQHPLISCVIEAAKLADIEVIDIIEETHADLLYYLSREEYSQIIKPGMKIAIFDIGGESCIFKIYEISEHEEKRYATCFAEKDTFYNTNDSYSGRSINDIIIRQLEESIPEDLRNKMKLRIVESSKRIKHVLSFQERFE